MPFTFLPTRNPNPLAYPAGTPPGFDAAHPLAAGGQCVFSAVASGPGMRLLTSPHNKVATTNGSPTAETVPILGPVIKYTSGQYHQWSPMPTPVPAVGYTVAVILFLDATATFQGYARISATGSTGLRLMGGDGTFFALGDNNVNSTPFFTGTPNLVNGEPYLFLGSICNGIENFVAKNLRTGAVTTGISANGQVIAAGDGTCAVGEFIGITSTSRIAAAMGSTVFLNLSQLKAVAEDPWSFWYPDIDDNWVGAAADVLMAQASF